MPKYKAAHRKRALVTPEASSKVPEEGRQCYVSLFVEKYLRVYKTEDEALKKAKIEEKAIYEHCGSRNMYVNIAINTLKKLRHQVLTGIILYRHLKDYLLTEEQLHENNYPQPNPDKPGSILFTSGMTKALVNDTSRKICCRCGKIRGVMPTGKHSRVEECNYHLGPVLSHKVLGGLETRYSCCEGVLGSAGCQVAKLHVHGWKENIEGFMKTFVKCPPADGNPSVFAVNCEVLIHTSVVDTTVLFPHWLGLPHKRSLKSLVADHLQRIIQDNVLRAGTSMSGRVPHPLRYGHLTDGAGGR
ncbi:RNA exonuclease 1 homolog [Zalophus californianus]|uniref:RNA exonuclease 1 homolog n=1 Tax=Zalophus californianus TaxID=9704 RepID=A0A6P9FC86_ZALCA|nr:RNA exonuclease 1 homolog [Zalophus californianus]